MDNPFYFNLARISAAQILRAAGIDRTRPSTLDTLTDILIRYLYLLGTQSMSFALIAGRTDPDIRDIRLAMEEVGIIAKGRLVSRKRLRRLVQQRAGEYEVDEEDKDPDGEDEDDDSTETLERLLKWFKGPQAAECRRVAGVSSGPSSGVSGLSGEQNQMPTFVAEYVTSCSIW
jgi:transcription initiation factor TFIID subunit 3